MSKRRVYVTDFWTGPVDVEQAALGETAEVIALGAHREADLLPRIADAAGLLVWHDTTISAGTIDALQSCRAIVRVGVGFDNVDREAAKRRGIAVCNVPDYGIEDVADHAIAMMLSLVRNLPQFESDLRATPLKWDARRCERSMRLRGKVFGVIGLGRIGSATALRAKAFGLDAVAFDPFIPDGRTKSLGIRAADTLAELLGQSDIVSLHTPLSDSTRGMINTNTLRQFKRGALLINTARGPICDTAAVLRALESKQLAGAGLDVIPVEPPTADDPLLAAYHDPKHVAHHRLILTPHSAFYTEEGFEEMRRKAALEVRRGILGETLRNRVN
jgi:D-3-phosphoglycerate dehydrogenase/C-terminal binding protein